jgi:RES domain-containing protein
MATAWRIVQSKHLAHAFDGEGARLFGGRWNSPGRRAVYCASSISLATLEMLVHLPSSAILRSYRLIPVEIPDALIATLGSDRLPKDWNRSPAPPELQELGDAWMDSLASAAWKVPSAIVPLEANFLLNPAHPGFAKLKIGKPIDYPIDPRLAV